LHTQEDSFTCEMRREPKRKKIYRMSEERVELQFFDVLSYNGMRRVQGSRSSERSVAANLET
jgi:hypothetical protein